MTRNIRLTAALGLMLSSLPLLASADESQATEPMSRQMLLKREIQTPPGSAETRVIRVTFPPGFKTPLHTHDGQGPRYILKGKLRVEDNGQTQVYGAGDVFWETGSAMTIENVSGSDAEMVIFEIAPAH
jgi:quercetin dioxygenase-like cupin family protein